MLGAALCASAAVSSSARADAMPRGHAAIALGGAADDPSGFRAGLDAAFGVAFLRRDGYHWLLGAAAESGFHQYPTYVMLEGGGTWPIAAKGFVSGLWTAGPAMRVDPRLGGGVEASVSVWFVLFEAGVRSVVIVSDHPEVQILGTVGLGLL